MNSVEKALQKATGVKCPAGIARKDYLRKLVEAAADQLPDDAWNALSPEAQLWVNTAATAYKANEEIADFPPDEPAAAAAPAKAPRAAPVRKAAAAAAQEEAAPQAPAPAAPARKPASSGVLIKQFMLVDPNISVKDLKDKLTELGANPSDLTITTVRSDFRQTLKFLKEAGKLRGVEI